ncbi:MAG: hypothetical protein ABTQ32_27950 [Myxococcaceae bacterium]
MNFGKAVLEVKNENGRVTLYRPAKDIIVAVSEGFITRDLWPPQVPFYDALHHEVPKLRIFRDASAVRSVEPAYASASQNYVRANKERYAEILFLQRSAVIALAINTASLISRAPMSAVGKEAWEQRLAAALQPRQAA